MLIKCLFILIDITFFKVLVLLVPILALRILIMNFWAYSSTLTSFTLRILVILYFQHFMDMWIDLNRCLIIKAQCLGSILTIFMFDKYVHSKKTSLTSVQIGEVLASPNILADKVQKPYYLAQYSHYYSTQAIFNLDIM